MTLSASLLGDLPGTRPAAPGEGEERPLRLLFGVIVALAFAVLIVWVLYQIAT